MIADELPGTFDAHLTDAAVDSRYRKRCDGTFRPFGGYSVHTFGDVHIYSNHEEQVKEQLSRSPKPLPIMRLNKNVTSIFEFTYSDFEIINYDPHPLIPGAVSI